MKTIRSFFILSLAFAFLATSSAAHADVSRWSFIEVGTGLHYPVEIDHTFHIAYSTDPNHFFFHPISPRDSKDARAAYYELGGDGSNVIEFELSLLKGVGLYIGMVGVGLAIIGLYAQYHASNSSAQGIGEMCSATIELGHAIAAQQAASCNPYTQTRLLSDGRTEICIHGQPDFQPSMSACGGVQFAGCTRSSCSTARFFP